MTSDVPSIAMLLTPPGSAAIAVARLTGPQVPGFLEAHFSRKPCPGRCAHGNLTDGEQMIDDPVVVLSDDEHVVDVNLHGGPWVVRSMLELARRGGFVIQVRPTVPLPDEAVDAEYPREREILAHLPLARTELALRELLGQREAWERLEALPAGELSAELAEMRADYSLWWLLHPPRVAIVGAPNVGKSTLANQLFAQQRSITADLPGTTRDWVGEIANVDGLAVLLVDTPGIRLTADPVEAAAIERSGVEIGAADLVLLVLDATRPLAPEQGELRLRFVNALVVVNKSEGPAAWQRGEVAGIETVATSGEGVDAVRAAIRNHFGIDARRGRAKWWTQDQREQLNLKSEI